MRLSRGNIYSLVECVRVLLLGPLVLCVVLMSGCNTLDERDICCEEVVLLYRYVRTGQDEYKDFIGNERRFLFDEGGFFVREVPVNPRERQRVSLQRLPVGTYTMVTVGNLSEEHTGIASLVIGKSNIRDFEVSLQAKAVGGTSFAEADELFWNSRRFYAEYNKRHVYYCDMANIHCHLYVKVGWKNIPPKGSPLFAMEMSTLTSGYHMLVNSVYDLHIAGEMTPKRPLESGYSFVLHQFPYHFDTASAKVKEEQSLRGHELYFSVVTLRYLNNRIPTLQLVHMGKELFEKPIDLTPIFHDWGWFPNRDHEQAYKIELYIHDDGNVEVRPWVDANVLDWEDGGTFGA